MKFITYRDGGGDQDQVGVLSRSGDSFFSLGDLGCGFADMRELIANCDEALIARLRKTIDGPGGRGLGEIELQAPIPHPVHDLLCVGQNYAAHAQETSSYSGGKWTKPDLPVYFSKRVDRAVAPGGKIKSHSDITSRLDYEAELAVIIGKTASRVAPGDVFRHVFGYTVANDVSARDLQLNHVQYVFGKSLDGFAPLGPWLVTADELPSPPHLAIRSRVNGELRQNSNTSDFIFDIPRLISELSSGIVLQPGDILLTGTPAGVGLGFKPPRFLNPGDVIECEIEGIGVLRNTVEQHSPG